jgi:hypothetical protein
MAAGTKFHNFVEALGKEVHNFSSDTLKCALSNTAPTAATDESIGDITQISAGNGYTSGGVTLGSVTWSHTSGTATLDFADFSWTASGGDIGPYRYLVIYNSTPATEGLIAYYDLGASETIADGSTKTFNIDASGLLTIA